MSRSRSYTPFREDLPITGLTWLFFIGTLLVFVVGAHIYGVGVFWGLFIGAVITIVGQATWRSVVGTSLMKQFFKRSLFGFVADIFRKRSVFGAAREMLSALEDAETTIEWTIQRESRWLVWVPLLLFCGTLLADLLSEANLRFFLVAEVYFFFVGLGWMALCRRGRLAMLALPFEG